MKNWILIHDMLLNLDNVVYIEKQEETLNQKTKFIIKIQYTSTSDNILSTYKTIEDRDSAFDKLTKHILENN